jgi:hypothetical protein
VIAWRCVRFYSVLSLPKSSSGLYLVDAIRRRIEPLGGVDLPVVPRDPVPEPLKLDE